ncbi:MAG: DUF4129 domain-containing protein [Candidatus Dormibacteria bacterium]
MRRHIAAALAVLLIVCGGVLRSATVSASCAALDYLASLQRAQSQLSASPPQTSNALDALHDAITSYPPASQALTPIVNDISATPPDVGDARAELGDITAALALPPGAVCNADVSPARTALTQVYGSRDFAGLDQPPPSESLLSRIADWFASLFRQAAQALGPAGAILLGGVMLLLVAVFTWWRVRAVRAGRAARISDEPPGDTDDPGREWAVAMQAASRGEYREAVRRAFRSALLEVARRGRLAVDPSWTTRELLRATQGDAVLITVLAPVADSFDTAWYSGMTVTREDWDRARVRCEAVRAAAKRRAPVNAA